VGATVGAVAGVSVGAAVGVTVDTEAPGVGDELGAAPTTACVVKNSNKMCGTHTQCGICGPLPWGSSDTAEWGAYGRGELAAIQVLNAL